MASGRIWGGGCPMGDCVVCSYGLHLALAPLWLQLLILIAWRQINQMILGTMIDCIL